MTSGRQPISQKQRWRIFARDNFTCQYCGRKPPDVALTIDHKEAVARGGDNSDENLLTACTDCNAGKGITPLSREVQEAIAQHGDWCYRCRDKRIQTAYRVTHDFASYEFLGLCGDCDDYFAGNREDDPAAPIVMRAMQEGLDPVVNDDHIMWFHTMGETRLGHDFAIDFKATPVPDEDKADVTVVLPWYDGVWIHAYWM